MIIKYANEGDGRFSLNSENGKVLTTTFVAEASFVKHLVMCVNEAHKSKLVLYFYHDPGHGWLAVERRTLREFGLIHRITPYSYQRGNTVYLEEDCDALAFVQAAKEAGVELDVVNKYGDKSSPIRSYESYKPMKGE